MTKYLLFFSLLILCITIKIHTLNMKFKSNDETHCNNTKDLENFNKTKSYFRTKVESVIKKK